MGTARMDADPAAGVVGTDGAVHGADGALRRRRQPAAELDRRQPDDDHHRDGLPRRPSAGRSAELKPTCDGRPKAAVAVNSLLPGRARPELRLGSWLGGGGGRRRRRRQAGGPEPRRAVAGSPRKRSASPPNEVPSSCIAMPAADRRRRSRRSARARPRSCGCGRPRCPTGRTPKSGGLMMLMMIRTTERMPRPATIALAATGSPTSLSEAADQHQADRRQRGDEQDDVDEAVRAPSIPRPLGSRPRSRPPPVNSRPNHLKMNMIRIRRFPIRRRSSRPG